MQDSSEAPQVANSEGIRDYAGQGAGVHEMLDGGSNDRGDGETPAVFISYASQNAAVANSVVEALERAGLKCWIAPRNVVPGSQYADEIVSAINDAKVFVLVLSGHAAASQHVGKEIERASSKRRRIIVLRTDSAPLTRAFEYFLSESQWIDLAPGGFDAASARLLDAVRRHVHPAVVTEPSLTSDLRGRPPIAKVWRKKRIMTAGVTILVLALAYLVVNRHELSARLETVHPSRVVEIRAPEPSHVTMALSDKSIAVLPFMDLSEKKDQEFLADGIAEELLNLLTKVTPLRVISRSSAFSFKGQRLATPEIAKRLNVANILEGSVRRSGNHVRVTAQLIDARSDTELWSETYDRTLNDLFAVQDQIAGAVVAQLKIKLLGTIPTVKLIDPRAHALYLQARQLGRLNTVDGFGQSIELYRQALAIDSAYADAWVGLSNNYAVQAAKALRPVDEGYRLAREAANRALALDPRSASALLQLSRIAGDYDSDLAAAARYLERALALEPANANVIRGAGNLAHDLGRMDQAVKLDEYAISSDPVNAGAYGALGYDYSRLGRLDDAIASYRTALTLSPERIGSEYNIGELLLRKGDARGALEAVQQETDESWRRVGLPMVYYSLGLRAQSDAALADLVAHQAKDWPYNIAYVFAWRGETDRAFEWLDKAAALRDPGLVEIIDEPFFASIVRDPRWLPFLRKIGRAPEQLAEIKFDVKLPESRGSTP
jgi:TolB-like protein/Tfp pilus assembly protein PilF